MSNEHQTVEQELSSRKKRWFFVYAGIIGFPIIFILIGLLFVRPDRTRFDHHFAEVKAGKRTDLFSPDARLLEKLLEFGDCAARVTAVWISEADILTEKWYSDLKKFPNLKVIRLEYLGDADEVLKNMQGMPNLEELSVHNSRISPTGAIYLKKFPHLSRLRLSGIYSERIKEFQELLPDCDVTIEPK
jgi:hypothetical protein